MAAPQDTSTEVIQQDAIPVVDPLDIEMFPVSSKVIALSPGGRDEAINHSNVIQSAAPIQEQIYTIWNPYMNRFRMISCCLTALGSGMNDSAPGALIVSIEKHYSIEYGTVAMIFVCNAAGYITAAFFIPAMSESLGRSKTLIVAQSLLMLGYLTIIFTPPFPAIAAAFFILGNGLATQLAIGQVFCSNLANNTTFMGLYQGAYGIGGIIGPLIATSLVSKGSLWSRFYILQLCVAAFNLMFSGWSFRGYEQDSGLGHFIRHEHESETINAGVERRWKSFKTLLSNKPTILGAAFIFAYQGAEVAISGWIISFLIQFRHGNPSKVGFVTSGFWAGITLGKLRHSILTTSTDTHAGRLTLSFLAHKMGERLFVFLVTIGALVLELLVWFVPSIPADSVAVAFSGLFLGPIYPCAVHILHRLISREMMISSLSLIASVGSSGGAVAPFLTGILAQKVGTYILHPICIGLFVSMCGCWWLLPKPERKRE